MSGNRERVKLSRVTLSLVEPETLKPSQNASIICVDGSRNKEVRGVNPWNGDRRTRLTANEITRPFSASLISPRREKKGTRLMNARRPSTSKLSDVTGLKSATFQKRTAPKPKVPEYDSSKVIADSAAARNRALAAEYVAMLSGRNYVKKQYRDQFWQNEVTLYQRPPSGRYIGERRPRTLYPDLGSVIGDRVPQMVGTPLVTPTSPPRSTGPWRLSAPSETSHAPPGKVSSVAGSQSNISNVDGSNTVQELGLTFRSKRSWSNIPSGKCYRVLSHPNDTLASLCLEGRSAASRASNSRTSSLSSTISLSGLIDGRYRLSSAGESTPSGSSDAISGQSRPGSGDEDQPKSMEFIESDDTPPKVSHEKEGGSEDEFTTVHGLSDSVFVEEENVEILKSDEERDDGDEDGAGEDEDEADEEYEENLPVDGVGRLSFSDLEESDISENEADGYEEEEAIDEDEVNRRLQQVSAVFDTTSDKLSSRPTSGTIEIAEKASDGESSNEFSDDDQELTQNYFDYAEFLPHPYNKCDLQLFATLPVGMDWRAFIQHKTNRKGTATGGMQTKSNVEKRKAERKAKEREAKGKKNLEDAIDRLIMLEKMQALTVQYEQDRRRHIIHRAKARNLQKSSSGNTQSNATSTPVATANADTGPPSARGQRRRSSTTLAIPSTGMSTKPRKSLPSNELRSDVTLNKPAPDLDLVRSSCTKNHLQYIRRSSLACRRRHRFGVALPRYYEYSWSERLPPSKRLSLSSLLYTKPRNCQQCRESDKRLAHLHVMQMVFGRPRSAFSTFALEQQKLHARPNTSNAVIRTPAEASKGNRNSQRPQTKHGSPTRDPTPVATFGRVPAKGTNRDTHENLFAARSVLSSVSRDYARAARRGSRHNRRSSTSVTATRLGRSSPCGVIRYRRDARILKPTIIDSANLRIR